MTDQGSTECVRQQYQTFWEKRMKRLRRYGISHAAFTHLDHQRPGLIDWLVQHGPFDGVPFLPVVPFLWWDLNSQFRWAIGAQDISERAPFPQMLQDRDDVPDAPYYAVNVHYRETLGPQSRQSAVRRIKDASRHPLTMAETTALALQMSPRVLRQSQLVVCGSGSADGGKDGSLCDLWITTDFPTPGFEIIELSDHRFARPDMRVPSCLTRLDPTSLWSDVEVASI